MARLLERIRSGDRTALALFIHRYESRIRRRIRGRLSATLRSVFDSQDILSTVGMRLDGLMRSGRLDVTTEQSLCAFIVSLAEHAVKVKGRTVGRRRQRELQYCLAKASARRGRPESGGASAPDVERILASLESETDRHLLMQWLAGTPLRAIAAQLGLTDSTIRKRWQRLKRELQIRLSPDSSAGSSQPAHGNAAKVPRDGAASGLKGHRVIAEEDFP